MMNEERLEIRSRPFPEEKQESCPVCGAPLVHAEGCLKCLYCGYGLCD